MSEVTVYGVVEFRDGSAFEYLTFDRGQLAARGGGGERAGKVSGERVVRVPGDFTSDGYAIRCLVGDREVHLDPYTLVTFAQLRLYGFELVSGDPWRPDEATAAHAPTGRSARPVHHRGL